MKIEIEPDAELKFVRKSLEESIFCVKGEDGKEEKKDLEALKRVLKYYGG